MTIHRTDFRQVAPTADEIADHVDRLGRKPAVDRAECRNCGTRIWYSGLAIGSHVRGCPKKLVAPEQVVEFYRSLPSAYGDISGDVFVAQAFRPGDGWVDLPLGGKRRPIFATKPNLDLLARRGFTAVAFDVLDDETPTSRRFVTADFPMAEVR
jgi:hypothetical protein